MVTEVAKCSPASETRQTNGEQGQMPAYSPPSRTRSDKKQLFLSNHFLIIKLYPEDSSVYPQSVEPLRTVDRSPAWFHRHNLFAKLAQKLHLYAKTQLTTIKRRFAIGKSLMIVSLLGLRGER